MLSNSRCCVLTESPLLITTDLLSQPGDRLSATVATHRWIAILLSFSLASFYYLDGDSRRTMPNETSDSGALLDWEVGRVFYSDYGKHRRLVWTPPSIQNSNRNSWAIAFGLSR